MGRLVGFTKCKFSKLRGGLYSPLDTEIGTYTLFYTIFTHSPIYHIIGKFELSK